MFFPFWSIEQWSTQTPSHSIRQRGKFFKCSFHLKSKSATPVLIKCKFDTHPLTVHYSQLFPRTRWALNYKVCEVIINYQECPTGFVGRYITDVTVSAKTNWFSRIREMMSLFVLSNVLPLHRKPYLPWKTDSQEYSLFMFYQLYYYLSIKNPCEIFRPSLWDVLIAWEKSDNVNYSPSPCV